MSKKILPEDWGKVYLDSLSMEDPDLCAALQYCALNQVWPYTGHHGTQAFLGMKSWKFTREYDGYDTALLPDELYHKLEGPYSCPFSPRDSWKHYDTVELSLKSLGRVLRTVEGPQ